MSVVKTQTQITLSENKVVGVTANSVIKVKGTASFNRQSINKYMEICKNLGHSFHYVSINETQIEKHELLLITLV